MSNDKILDKIKGIACVGSEVEAVGISIERLKAVIACLKSFCKDVEYTSPQDGAYIVDMVELIEETTGRIDNGFDAYAHAILDILP